MDLDAVAVHAIARVRDLLSAGVSKAQLRHRSASGRWRRVGIGCVAMFTGEPSRLQRLTIAVLSGGPDAVLTGSGALSLSGIRYAPPAQPPTALVPATVRRTLTMQFAVIPTTRMPVGCRTVGGLPVAPTHRAVADACRVPGVSARQARAVVAEAVQRGHTTPELLVAELHAGPRRWSLAMRTAIDDVLAGARSAPEAEARRLLQSSSVIDSIEFNVDLIGPTGLFVARPDAWIDSAALAVEVDSAAHHFLLQDWQSTQRRAALLAGFGALVLSIAPMRLRDEPNAVLRDIERAYRHRRDAGLRVALRPRRRG